MAKVALLLLLMTLPVLIPAVPTRVCPCNYKTGTACDCKHGGCSCGALCWCHDPNGYCRAVKARTTMRVKCDCK